MKLFCKHHYRVMSWTLDTITDSWDNSYKRNDTSFELCCKKCGKLKDYRIKRRALSAKTADLMCTAKGWEHPKFIASD